MPVKSSIAEKLVFLEDNSRRNRFAQQIPFKNIS